ncbi:unnamed protein product [Closterium sp. Naga37s-1]|nr:unnamed protein product [Closterium sp. Naga37s-1]
MDCPSESQSSFFPHGSSASHHHPTELRGKFDVKNLNYSFKPDNAVLLVQSLTGTLLGTNVNSQNLQVPIESDNIPTLNGQLIARVKMPSDLF